MVERATAGAPAGAGAPEGSRLALWARPAGPRPPAVALLRGGRLALAGPGWRALCADPGTWRRAGGRQRGALEALVLAEAEAMCRRKQSWGNARLECGPRSLELRLLSPAPWLPGGPLVLAALSEGDPSALDPSSEELLDLGRMAAGVAHDLNNGLFAVALRLEGLAQGAREPLLRARLGELLELIRQEAERVNQLHGLASSASPARWADLRELILEAVDLAQPGLKRPPSPGSAAWRVEARLAPLGAVRCQPAEVRHLFLNLLLNARDAMPDGGQVRVRGRQLGRWAEVEVLDEGVGLPAGDPEQVFQPRFSTKGVRGHGLGLSSARDLMGRLGGTIVAARLEPRGTRFTLRFPLGPGGRASPSARRPARAGGAPRRVLVVDDQGETRAALAAALAHHRTDLAVSARAGLARLSKRPGYHAILCSLELKRSDGWAFAAEARRLAPRTPVYLLTAWPERLVRPRGDAALVAGVLQVPLEPGALERALHPPRPRSRR